MSLKDKLLLSLKSKKGNALLLATATAIAASFSVYFFVAITALSQEQKERIAHLYNAYQMGLGVEALLDGANKNEDRIKASDGEKSQDIDKAVGDKFKNGTEVTLKTLIEENVIRAAPDPTASAIKKEETPYDITATTVKIDHLDGSGNVIDSSGGSTSVAGLRLLVNLAGTMNISSAKNIADKGDNNYGTGPFYYIIMDNSSLSSFDVSISSTDHPVGILSGVNGGPQPESSVLLPKSRTSE